MISTRRICGLWVCGLACAAGVVSMLGAGLVARAQTRPAASSQAATTDSAGDVLDAIVAVINGQAVTRSEVEDEAHYARFVKKLAAAGPLAKVEEETALNHIIDQTLVLQAARTAGFSDVPDSSVDEQWRRIREQSGGAAELDRQLAAYRLNDEIVHDILRDQLTILAFLDRRFQPSISVSERSISRYYRNVLVPQLAAQGAAAPPLAEVHDKIAELLGEQQRAEYEKNFIETLRHAATIQIRK